MHFILKISVTNSGATNAHPADVPDSEVGGIAVTADGHEIVTTSVLHSVFQPSETRLWGPCVRRRLARNNSI